MQLADYLKEKKISPIAFAKKLGVSAVTVWRWRNGRIPRKDDIRRISQAAEGAVTAADFYEDNHDVTR